MKRIVLLFLILTLLFLPPAVRAEEEEEVSYAVLLADMAAAYEQPSTQTVSKLERDAAAMDDPVASALAARWEQVYVDRSYRPLLFGRDDPRQIPVTGKHAFVVLGYALENGAMADELKGRCDAAAAAARAFPDSLILCTGGATGENNPDKHTEADLMKEYLVEIHGLDSDRILTETEAMTTADNAANVMSMLRERQVNTLTVVTSDYHLPRAQVLYTAAAARCQAELGYPLEVVGDYAYQTPPNPDADYVIALFQLLDVLELPDEQRELYYHLVYGD